MVRMLRALFRLPVPVTGRLCVFLCAVSCMAVSAACTKGDEHQAVQRPVIRGVSVSSVSPVEVDDVFEASGSIRSNLTSLIASRVMGVVTALKVREGDHVEEGQLLMTIDDREASERLKAASMAASSAKQNRDLALTTWRRYRALFEKAAVSRQEMDEVENRRSVTESEYGRAKAMADEARTQLGFSRVTAPVSGWVKEKKIDVGTMAVPGMHLLTIEGRQDKHDLYVEVAVDESLTHRIKTGNPVEVNIDALNKNLKGFVREIVPAVDPLSRTFIAKVSVEDAQLRSGLFARVRIPLNKRQALLVPDEAIVSKGQLTGVYVVDRSSVVIYRLIRTGKRFTNGTEVLSGLSPQERIIIRGVEHAIDGGIVRRERPE